jgi:hypothetical protein
MILSPDSIPRGLQSHKIWEGVCMKIIGSDMQLTITAGSMQLNTNTDTTAIRFGMPPYTQ